MFLGFYCIMFFLLLRATVILLVFVLVVVNSLKIPKAFLIRSGAQRNFAYTFVLILPTDLPSQIFHYFLTNE